MPQIIVTAGDADLEGAVTLRERINASDFESERFAVNLLERLGWAVSDATEVEQTDSAGHEDALEFDEVDAPRELVKA
jgi:hypothetical protein